MFIEQQHAQDSGGNYLFISGFKFNWYVHYFKIVDKENSVSMYTLF